MKKKRGLLRALALTVFVALVITAAFTLTNMVTAYSRGSLIFGQTFRGGGYTASRGFGVAVEQAAAEGQEAVVSLDTTSLLVGFIIILVVALIIMLSGRGISRKAAARRQQSCKGEKQDSDR